MTVRAIPPGFVSREAALERANEKWGERDAKGKVKGLLVTGALIGWNGYDDRYPPQQLTSEFWRTSDAWGLIEDGESYPRARRKYFLLFRAEDLDLNLPVPEAPEPQSSDQGSDNESRPPGASGLQVRNVGGNPGKYDWEEMWIEIAAMLYEGFDFPDLGRKEEIAFRKRLQQWFVEKVDSHPDDKLIVPKIKRLFERLKKPPLTE